MVLDRKNREKEAAVHENRGNESGLQAPSNPTCASFTKACDRTHIPTLLGKGRVVFLSNVLTPDGEVSRQTPRGRIHEAACSFTDQRTRVGFCFLPALNPARLLVVHLARNAPCTRAQGPEQPEWIEGAAGSVSAFVRGWGTLHRWAEVTVLREVVPFSLSANLVPGLRWGGDSGRWVVPCQMRRDKKMRVIRGFREIE